MASYTDPYHGLGLARNPFMAPGDRVLRDGGWCDFGYALPDLTPTSQFIECIGAKGAGKTTHLHHWHGQTGGVYFYQKPGLTWALPPYSVPPDSLKDPQKNVVYWDEADRIPVPLLVWALGQARQRGITVVVGSHQSLAHWARPWGFVTHTWPLDSLTLPHLRVWIDRHFDLDLLPRRLPDQQKALERVRQELTDEFLSALIDQSQGSWRWVASQLHQWLAQQAREVSQSLKNG